jgi:hypothetical protein|tara:strand:- start:215 stop:349 length:135 start_codon:yes stop_codon:yes gene_type:complete
MALHRNTRAALFAALGGYSLSSPPQGLNSDLNLKVRNNVWEIRR